MRNISPRDLPFLPLDDVMPELGNENSKIIKTLWKAVDSERLDHSVLHLLVTTIFKYLSTWKPTTDESELLRQV